jgi:hypothetical protein
VLLASPAWVAQVTGMELLGALEQAESASADAKEIRKLARDKRVLRDWWGPSKGTPKTDRKADPTLGQVAAEVAKRLEDVAKRREEVAKQAKTK